MTQHEQKMREALISAAHDARVMAFVLGAGGLLFVGLGFVERSEIRGMLLMATASVFLLGPAVVYAMVCRALIKADGRLATFGLRVAVVHIILSTAFMAIWFAPMTWIPIAQRWVMLPGTVSAFLVPAMGAFVYHLTQARRAAREVSSAGRGFVVQPVRVIPLESADQSSTPG